MLCNQGSLAMTKYWPIQLVVFFEHFDFLIIGPINSFFALKTSRSFLSIKSHGSTQFHTRNKMVTFESIHVIDMNLSDGKMYGYMLGIARNPILRSI